MALQKVCKRSPAAALLYNEKTVLRVLTFSRPFCSHFHLTNTVLHSKGRLIMPASIKTPQEVLDKIGAEDFRSIKKDQLIAFISSIPDMDKETAIKCIEQFPEFRKQSTEIIGQLREQCDTVIEDNRTSRNEAVNAYKTILDECSFRLRKDDITDEQIEYLLEKMSESADKITDINRENASFLNTINNKFVALASAALLIGGAILGVKAISKR